MRKKLVWLLALALLVSLCSSALAFAEDEKQNNADVEVLTEDSDTEGSDTDSSSDDTETTDSDTTDDSDSDDADTTDDATSDDEDTTDDSDSDDADDTDDSVSSDDEDSSEEESEEEEEEEDDEEFDGDTYDEDTDETDASDSDDYDDDEEESDEVESTPVYYMTIYSGAEQTISAGSDLTYTIEGNYSADDILVFIELIDPADGYRYGVSVNSTQYFKFSEDYDETVKTTSALTVVNNNDATVTITVSGAVTALLDAGEYEVTFFLGEDSDAEYQAETTLTITAAESTSSGSSSTASSSSSSSSSAAGADTGDVSDIMLWICVAAVSAALMAGMFAKKKIVR